jgi:ribose transport system substrate-binding protein
MLQMRRSFSRLALAAAMATSAVHAQPRELKSVGLSLGSLNNPFFISLSTGAQAQAKKINPAVKFLSVSAEWEQARQLAQLDSFIQAGVDMILINVVDPNGMGPAILRAKQAGIVVVAVDVEAPGADATVMTNNVQAGQIACQHIVDKLGGQGHVVIQAGPQTSSVLDRIKGCKSVLQKAPAIKLLSDEQRGKGSREDGMRAMHEHLTRFDKLDAVFAFNDQQAIGADLAARQLKRRGIVITAVDGSPEIESALKGPTEIQASASQDPYAMAVKAVEVGAALLNGAKPPQTVLLPSTLVTRDNVKDYKGWQAAR